MTVREGQPPQSPPSAPTPSDSSAQRPWRTEGIPSGQPAKPRPGWTRWALWPVGYLILFAMFTYQDRMSEPEAVSYTEFKGQVASKNVKEVFARGDTIQGALKKAAPLPDQQDRTYEKFTTERPTFATDDLLAELIGGEATVRAKPLVQERGVLTNLLFSIGPLLLLFGFYFWMFRRQQRAMGGGILGGRARKPVDPETVRVTFDDVAGIDEVEAEINEVVDFLRQPAKYRRLGARAPKGVLLDRSAGNRQDAAGPRHRWRGECAVLQRQRVRVHRDDRRRRRQSGPRTVRGSTKGRPGDHLHRRDRHHRAHARRERARRPR